MELVSKKHLRFDVPIELRALAIPATWSGHTETFSGEWCFVPTVNQSVERRIPRLCNADEIRQKFLKLEINEGSAERFLNEVGVWNIVKQPQTGDGRHQRVFGAFGHDLLDGWATIETLDSLRQEQKYWRELIGSPKKQRKLFPGPPASGDTPAHKSAFAIQSTFGNTLRVHLEWERKQAGAVVQPVTVRELLVALSWIDLVTGAECRVCKNCKEPYTRGGYKFCDAQCERAYTMRTYRKNCRRRML